MSIVDIRGAGGTVAKTLVDIDEKLLVAAQAALGTTTKKETVNAALAQAAALAARRRDIERLCAGGLPDLADTTVTSSAWR
jgi:Arc/MetJ family transcription regulator